MIKACLSCVWSHQNRLGRGWQVRERAPLSPMTGNILARITDVTARIFQVPLAEVLTDAKHGDHTHFELITATIRLSDGREGTGYTYTGGKGGQMVNEADIVFVAQSDQTPHIQEVHATSLHAVCEVVEHMMFDS